MFLPFRDVSLRVIPVDFRLFSALAWTFVALVFFRSMSLPFREVSERVLPVDPSVSLAVA